MSKVGQIHSAPSPQDHIHTHPSSTSIAIPHDIESSSSAAAAAVDYKARAQWLRAAVLGANDGLVSVSSLILGVAAANPAPKATLISGLAGLVAGACSMAIGEYVSVSTQLDIEANQDPDAPKEGLPRPMQAAAASACAFAAGAALPLAAGGFIRPWGVRVGVVCAVSSLGLAGFGAAGAALGGGDRVGRSGARVLVGGWMAMLVTYGVVRMVGVLFNMQVSAAST